MARQVQRWEAMDGKVFEDEEQAVAHERYLSFVDLCRECGIDEHDADDLYRRRWQLVRLLGEGEQQKLFVVKEEGDCALEVSVHRAASEGALLATLGSLGDYFADRTVTELSVGGNPGIIFTASYIE